MSKFSPPLRSLLFAPSNHARRVEKALSLDADAVILDLEDAVAIAEKPAAREAITATLARPRQGLLYVRVNAIDTEFCHGDLLSVIQPGLSGIILPKVENPAALTTIDWLLVQLERERELPAGAIDVIPIIETARGLQRIDAILAAGTRVRRIAFGAGEQRSPMPAQLSLRRRARPGLKRLSTRFGLTLQIQRGWKTRHAWHGHTASRARCASIRTRLRS